MSPHIILLIPLCFRVVTQVLCGFRVCIIEDKHELIIRMPNYLYFKGFHPLREKGDNL